ncbi:hypothetical protein [Andreprevotia sp. IGB-42]|uniref:hypothetical protein n=1 Tax=Andreprevotia sp. IGB-42 TaxID=2497473 RepID=UPI0013592F77|nr:hypothetical protein [Andreprevotia sp. IGB-42]
MDESLKIIFTTCLTIFGSTLVFVFGQILGKFFIDPTHDFRKTIGDIQFALVFHQQAISTPVGNRESELEASHALRRLACDLSSKAAAIPAYNIWSKILPNYLPNPKEIHTAAANLIGLSNSVFQENRHERNYKTVSKIQTALGIRELIDQA